MPKNGVSPAPYYEALGRGCDAIFRCKDCRKIVLESDLRKYGSCGCGNKRVVEVSTLTEIEMAEVQAMEFPYKAEFLAEFAAHE